MVDGVGGRPLKDTSARLQGWTGMFFPTPGSWVLMSGMDGGALMTLVLRVRNSQGHETLSPVFQEQKKSCGPARDSLGPVGAERRGQGWRPSQGSSPRKTVCPHGTWGIPWFVLRQMRGDTQQTFRKGFETSLLGESWLTNAYSLNWQTHRAPTGC